MKVGTNHFKSLLDEHIERLLQKRVLQEEPRSVSFSLSVIGISTFIQRLAEDFSAQWHPAADEDARQLPELDVGQTVFPELEAAPVADLKQKEHLI